MKEYGQMPNGEVIMNHYKDYMDGHDLADDDRKMLFRFFHEIVGCVNLLWKEKSLKSGTFSKVTTTSDEAFAFFIMRDYAKITTKQDRKQVKLAGENLENAIQFFEEKMTEIKQMKKEHSGRITQLDDDIREYIKKNMHARNDNDGGRRMRVQLKATQELANHSKTCLISMIYVKSITPQCDKRVVCHTGVKRTSCSFHFFFF